jgi:hypothetical protein
VLAFDRVQILVNDDARVVVGLLLDEDMTVTSPGIYLLS